MLIKVIGIDSGEISHSSGKYPIIHGCADLPNDLYAELINFKTIYSPITEEIPQDILDEIQGNNVEPEIKEHKKPGRPPKK